MFYLYHTGVVRFSKRAFLLFSPLNKFALYHHSDRCNSQERTLPTIYAVKGNETSTCFTFNDGWISDQYRADVNTLRPSKTICVNKTNIIWINVGLTLTHWGRVRHIWVGNIAIVVSDNDLSPERRRAIIEANAGILLICLWGTNFSNILIEIHTFSLNKIHWKILSGKWKFFCLVASMC